MSTNQRSRHNKSGRHNHKSNNRGRPQNSRGGRKGGSKKQQHKQPLTATRQIDSSGPTGKIRGNVKQLYDQYKSLAHDVRTKDRTLSEACGQYAHHYYTLYSEFAAAEAALEVEREKERLRKQEEAAENQSNVVEAQNDDADVADIEQIDDAEKEAPKAKKRPSKKDDEVPLELPLDIKEPSPEPLKKRAPKKPKKAKEEVAE